MRIVGGFVARAGGLMAAFALLCRALRRRLAALLKAKDSRP
jgi:hypothetical protein